MTNSTIRVRYVRCPICHEPGMMAVPQDDDGKGPMEGWMIRCTNLACASNQVPPPPTVAEQLVDVLRGHNTAQGLGPQLAQAAARRVMEAGTWTPLDDPTSTDLIHAALNYHSSEIEGNVIVIDGNVIGYRDDIPKAFTRAVQRYRERRGMTGVAASDPT